MFDKYAKNGKKNPEWDMILSAAQKNNVSIDISFICSIHSHNKFFLIHIFPILIVLYFLYRQMRLYV